MAQFFLGALVKFLFQFSQFFLKDVHFCLRKLFLLCECLFKLGHNLINFIAISILICMKLPIFLGQAVVFPLQAADLLLQLTDLLMQEVSLAVTVALPVEFAMLPVMGAAVSAIAIVKGIFISSGIGVVLYPRYPLDQAGFHKIFFEFMLFLFEGEGAILPAWVEDAFELVFQFLYFEFELIVFADELGYLFDEFVIVVAVPVSVAQGGFVYYLPAFLRSLLESLKHLQLAVDGVGQPRVEDYV